MSDGEFAPRAVRTRRTAADSPPSLVGSSAALSARVRRKNAQDAGEAGKAASTAALGCGSGGMAAPAAPAAGGTPPAPPCRKATIQGRVIEAFKAAYGYEPKSNNTDW